MQFLMKAVQFALNTLLFVVEFIVFCVLLVTVYVFGWAIALTVDNETGHLPWYFKWFETTDVSCFDPMWVEEHPTWSKCIGVT
jgi:hypothetical protein